MVYHPNGLGSDPEHFYNCPEPLWQFILSYESILLLKLEVRERALWTRSLVALDASLWLI